MTFGDVLIKARKAKGWSQLRLAEEIGVSAEAVSKWECNAYRPNGENLAVLEQLLGLSMYDENGEPRNGRLFDEDRMSAFLKGKMNSLGMKEAAKALGYAKRMHESSAPRKGPAKVPYINHPLTMACHAFAMGLEDDILLAALLLHDVSEDCGVAPAELPFPAEVQRLVALVTKPPKPYSEEKYYAGIGTDPRACLIKCIDRCNNLSTMALGFPVGKIAEYVEETERFYPELLRVVKDCPAYNDAAWLLEYQIRSLVETARRIR